MPAPSKPEISVIIPYFNNSKTIGRALRSVSEQLFKNYEIIVVNDGSDDWDEAQRIVNDFNFEKLTIVHHNKNSNGAVARNTGIERAVGNFIAFLDSDDEWLADHLLKSIDFCKEYSYRSTRLFLCSSIIIHHNSDLSTRGIKRNLDVTKVEKVISVLEEIYVKNRILSCPTFFFSRDVVENVKFDTSLRRFQDIDFCLNASQIPGLEFYLLPHVGARVHWNDLSINKLKSKGLKSDSIQYFLNKNITLFDDRTKSKFIHKELIPVLASEFKITGVIRLLIAYHSNINFKGIITILSYLSLRRSDYVWKTIQKIRNR